MEKIQVKYQYDNEYGYDYDYGEDEFIVQRDGRTLRFTEVKVSQGDVPRTARYASFEEFADAVYPAEDAFAGGYTEVEIIGEDGRTVFKRAEDDN